jgi:hypothetical protein
VILYSDSVTAHVQGSALRHDIQTCQIGATQNPTVQCAGQYPCDTHCLVDALDLQARSAAAQLLAM